jgi:hypothetical protein
MQSFGYPPYVTNHGGEDAGLSAVSGAGRYVLFYGEFAGSAFGFAGSAFGFAGSAYRSGAGGGANYETGAAFLLVPFGYVDAWVCYRTICIRLQGCRR